jgi:hypothetical protein
VGPVPARSPPVALMVEIGSFRGRSMVVLASAAAPGVTLVAIDPHAGNDRGPQEFSGFEVEAVHRQRGFQRQPRGRRCGAIGCVTSVSSRTKLTATWTARSTSCTSTALTGWLQRSTTSDRWGERVKSGGDLLIHDSFSSVGVTGGISVSAPWSGLRSFATSAGRSR